jgi:cobalt/nickel transport protein
MIDNKTFVAIGIVIALLIGVVAVFMASGDPDGLESTALVVSGQKDLTGPAPEEGDPEVVGTGSFAYEAPMPDYSLGEEMGSLGGLIAIVVGILVTLLIVLGISWIIAMNKGNLKS